MEKKVETEVKEQRSIEIQEREAFENFIRGYTVHERAGELTPAPYDPSTTPAGAGGALIPTTIVKYIIRKVYDICPILERSQKFNVKGNLSVPYYPADTTNKINVAYQDEFSPLASSSGSFDTVTLGGFLAGCLTKISRSLINNVQFDIVGFVVDEMAYAISRWIEGELLNGTNSKVTGLSTLTNGVTSASGIAITADEVVKLHDSIKDQFQRDAIWIMSPKTRDTLRTLKNQLGIYLLNDDLSAPFGKTLLGKPVFVSDKPHHLKALMECGVKPMVNQIEFHPGQLQEEIRDYCRRNGIQVEAYSPFGTGKILQNETLSAIASHYGKSTAQLCLRWSLQHDVIPLPKSVNPERMRQNTDIFDFEITPSDMKAIDEMPYIGGSGMDPDTVDW